MSFLAEKESSRMGKKKKKKKTGKTKLGGPKIKRPLTVGQVTWYTKSVRNISSSNPSNNTWREYYDHPHLTEEKKTQARGTNYIV